MAAQKPTPQIEKRKITDFTPDPSNANKGSERGLRILNDSIASSGLGRSVLADKNGILIAGNKTQERAVDSGFEDAIVVHSTGKQLVIVQRDDLDLLDNDPNNPARRMAYFDNVASQHMAWDAAQIAADVEAGVDLRAMFMPFELNSILNSDANNPAAEWVGMPEFEQEAINAFKEIRIVFEQEQDMKDFAKLIQQTITDKTTMIYFPKKAPRELEIFIEQGNES